MPDTYTVSTWELEEGWAPYRTGLSKWEVRDVLRRLYECQYTQISVRVEAETHDRPAARFDRDWMPSTDLPRSVKRKLMEAYQ